MVSQPLAERFERYDRGCHSIPLEKHTTTGALKEALMSESTRTVSPDIPLEDLYGRIGIAAVAAAARYVRKGKVKPAREAERSHAVDSRAA
jgi:hypothetical protein